MSGFWLLVLIFCGIGLPYAPGIHAQSGAVDAAARAVVRIRGCDISGCNRALGSGVIIDPSGLILTANHVTLRNAADPTSPRLDDFLIEITEDARRAPMARYRARIAAIDAASDLALLEIYGDEATRRDIEDPAALDLPYLALEIGADLPLGGELHLLGYPLAGGSNINYALERLSGYDTATLLKVTAGLGQGYSGGPALLAADDGLRVVGVIVRQRSVAAQETTLIRSVDALAQGLTWAPGARRAWLDDVAVTSGGADGSTLAVAADFHVVDPTDLDLTLLAYIFDVAGRPWTGGAVADRTLAGQAVLKMDLPASAGFLETDSRQLAAGATELGADAAQLAVHLVLWDRANGRALWRTVRPLAPAPEVVALAPTATVTATPSPTATDTPAPTATLTATPDHLATQAAVATDVAATLTAQPTRTPTVTATSTATQTPTPTPTSTPAPAEPAAGTVREFGGIPFVYVPAGEFIMGSDDGASDEQPVHTVYLDEYWIMQTEVTNAQYAACVDAGGCRAPNNERWDDVAYLDHPVTHVSWDDGVAYATWLSTQTGRTIRLPTEAEWEKAARGTDAWTFPWGDFWDGTRLNYCDRNCTFDWQDESVDDGFAVTAPVGTYPDGASPFGALDMAGNVWEWTADCYAEDYYAESPSRNPIGPSCDDRRVVRGGSWDDFPRSVRAAARGRNSLVARSGYLGLRLASPGF